MRVFIPDKKDFKKRILLSWVGFYLVLAIVPSLADYFFETNITGGAYWFLLAVFTIQSAIEFYNTERLKFIAFDTDNKEVVIETITFSNQTKRRVLAFHEIYLQVSRPFTSSANKSNPLALTFYKKRKTMLILNSYKDGVTRATLEEIQASVKELCHPLQQNA